MGGTLRSKSRFGGTASKHKTAGMSLYSTLLAASLNGVSVGSGLDIGFHTNTLGNFPSCPVATSIREGDNARHLRSHAADITCQLLCKKKKTHALENFHGDICSFHIHTHVISKYAYVVSMWYIRDSVIVAKKESLCM
jgi:hypothetical protein